MIPDLAHGNLAIRSPRRINLTGARKRERERGGDEGEDRPPVACFPSKSLIDPACSLRRRRALKLELELLLRGFSDLSSGGPRVP